MPNPINLKTKKQIYAEQEKARKGKNGKQKKEGMATQNDEQNLPQILRWFAYEFDKHQKEPIWFIFSGLIALILFIIAIFSKNFIFALIIIIASFLIFIWAQKQPRKIKFALTPKGIKIKEDIYAYDHLKSFWIFYEPPDIKYLSVESKKLFMPRIMIPLGDENPNKVREFLLKYLPEEEQHESAIDTLGRRLKY
jgi:hypothetical protein